jgi:hypothetical protein
MKHLCSNAAKIGLRGLTIYRRLSGRPRPVGLVIVLGTPRTITRLNIS